MRYLRYFAFVLLLGVFGISGPTAAEQVEVISLKDLRAKYATDSSQYIDVDGIETHYVDEGSGPAVVLLHATNMNLRAWNSVTEVLKGEFRVIRFDFPAAGLSGVDSKKKESVKRYEEQLAGLVDMLDLDTFALVATSSGGIAGFRYAANHPQRVTRLVLLNSAGLPRTQSTNPNRLRLQDIPLNAQSFWNDFVDVQFIDPHVPPDWLTEMMYDAHRRDDFVEASSRFSYEPGDPQSKLAKLRMPTLILWGMENPKVVHLDADVFQHWLTGAPSLVKKYPGTGHYAYLEEPALVGGDIKAFLLGELDGELRQTQMVRPKDF